MNTWQSTEQYAREQESGGNHGSMCCLMVPLAYRKFLDVTRCSLQGSPVRGARSLGAAQTLNALYVLKCMKRKEERLMFKRFIRWILPLMVLVLIATYFVLSPIVASYTAGPNVQTTHTATPHIYFLEPDFFIRH
jgi:hypothetical protein